MSVEVISLTDKIPPKCLGQPMVWGRGVQSGARFILTMQNINKWKESCFLASFTIRWIDWIKVPKKKLNEKRSRLFYWVRAGSEGTGQLFPLPNKKKWSLNGLKVKKRDCSVCIWHHGQKGLKCVQMASVFLWACIIKHCPATEFPDCSHVTEHTLSYWGSTAHVL